MYKAIDIYTGEVILTSKEMPVYVPKNSTIIFEEDMESINDYIAKLNEFASEEIGRGYTTEDGILFSMSSTDQLNYTAAASLVNMGADKITITGEKDGDKYYEVSLTAEEAKALFEKMFTHVKNILSKYRNYKKTILNADPSEAKLVAENILTEIRKSQIGTR